MFDVDLAGDGKGPGDLNIGEGAQLRVVGEQLGRHVARVVLVDVVALLDVAEVVVRSLVVQVDVEEDGESILVEGIVLHGQVVEAVGQLVLVVELLAVNALNPLLRVAGARRVGSGLQVRAVVVLDHLILAGQVGVVEVLATLEDGVHTVAVARVAALDALVLNVGEAGGGAVAQAIASGVQEHAGHHTVVDSHQTLTRGICLVVDKVFQLETVRSGRDVARKVGQQRVLLRELLVQGRTPAVHALLLLSDLVCSPGRLDLLQLARHRAVDGAQRCCLLLSQSCLSGQIGRKFGLRSEGQVLFGQELVHLALQHVVACLHVREAGSDGVLEG
mmetsp:Transcript_20846/g.34883  ORF Transcript_20846/g.34883 Transcript_20846/m.34883 type:complete len:332 (-) Transcript_20846:2482-3477(-)